MKLQSHSAAMRGIRTGEPKLVAPSYVNDTFGQGQWQSY